MQDVDVRERPLTDLFGDLVRELGVLFHNELRLAKTEMVEKTSTVGRNVGLVSAGGALGLAGVLALLGAVILVLSNVMPLWFSSLLVGLFVTSIGYFLIQKGLTALRQIDLAPRETVQTLKEDKQWVKERLQ